MADTDDTNIPWTKLVILVIILGIGAQLGSRLCGGPTPLGILQGSDKHKSLQAYERAYERKRVIKVTEDVYMATGYALGNVILIQAPDGAIIVDTTEDLEVAREIRAVFRNITKASIKAILLTHHHPDHTYGIKAFVEDNEVVPQIWAHESYKGEVERNGETSRAHFTRAMRQFGPLLPQEMRSGIKLRLNMETGDIGPMQPTHYLKEEVEDVEIAGMSLKLMHLPGETNDHMGIWIPHMELLLSGDNMYPAFPNLYALRGSTPRHTMPWVRSLDRMIKMKPEILVPSHSFPIHGKRKVSEHLGIYRDAIQVIHDQTVRYINKGLHPDDIVPLVKLPPELQSHPYLQEVYGTVRWSVKGIYSSYLGWFSGSPTEIEPMTTKEKAQRMIQLAGGVGGLAAAAQNALDKGDYRWALELSSYIFRLNPDHVHSKQIRLESIKALAASQTSSNGRNYFLTIALEDHNLVDIKVPNAIKKYVSKTMPLRQIFRTMALKLKAEEVEGLHKNVVFNFTDVHKVYNLELRNCLIDVQEDYIPTQYDIMVTMESNLWRKLISEEESPLKAYLKGDLVIEGGVLAFRQFIGYFERDD